MANNRGVSGSKTVLSYESVIRGSQMLNHVRGWPVMPPPLIYAQNQHPDFLSWWREYWETFGSQPARWPSWSGPMFHRERLELVRDAEWASLDESEQEKLNSWLRSKCSVGLCFD